MHSSRTHTARIHSWSDVLHITHIADIAEGALTRNWILSVNLKLRSTEVWIVSALTEYGWGRSFFNAVICFIPREIASLVAFGDVARCADGQREKLDSGFDRVWISTYIPRLLCMSVYMRCCTMRTSLFLKCTFYEMKLVSDHIVRWDWFEYRRQAANRVGARWRHQGPLVCQGALTTEPAVRVVEARLDEGSRLTIWWVTAKVTLRGSSVRWACPCGESALCLSIGESFSSKSSTSTTTSAGFECLYMCMCPYQLLPSEVSGIWPLA